MINLGGFCNFLSLQYNSKGEKEEESELINVGGEGGAGTAGTLRANTITNWGRITNNFFYQCFLSNVRIIQQIK